MHLTYGSVCSGIEAASVAWEPLGWRPLWFAQYDPEHDYSRGPDFPSAVLAHHWPHIRNLGDMTRLADLVELGIIDAPDVLVGGTPCQDFSVAGRRAGLKGNRGQLTLAFLDLVDALDRARAAEGKPPIIVVWENVPGVLSDKTNAFGCFLAGLTGEDLPLEPPGKRWSDAGVVLGPERAVAWRVLDAQFQQLAQRRRRVFVVASARAGFDPAGVLLEFQGLRRDSPPSREAGEDLAGTVTSRIGNGDGRGGSDRVAAFGGNNQSGAIEVATARTAHGGPHGRLDFETETFVVQPVQTVALRGREGGATAELGGEQANALRASAGGGSDPYVLAPVAFVQNSRSEVRLVGGDGSITGALAADPGAQQQQHYVAFQTHGSNLEVDGDIAGTLGTNCDRASGSAPCLAFRSATEFLPQSSRVYSEHETSPTLQATGKRDGNRAPQIVAAMAVRRLMPTECALLQGFPPHHARIPWRGRPAEQCPDGPQYKAYGNSMATKVMEWIGRRIEWNIAVQPDLDSLVG